MRMIRPFAPKINETFCRVCPNAGKTMQIDQKKILLNEIDAPDSSKWGIVPEISQSDDRNENLSPRGRRYNLRPNPNPNYSEDFRC